MINHPDIQLIDTSTDEGKLLMAAIAIMTVSPQLRILKEDVNGQQKTPFEMMAYLMQASDVIYPERAFVKESEGAPGPR